MSFLKKLTRLFRRSTPASPTEYVDLQNAADLDDLRRKSVRTQREEKILWVIDHDEIYPNRAEPAELLPDAGGLPHLAFPDGSRYRGEYVEVVEDAYGTSYLALPDGDHHEARLQPLVKGAYDRIFWANLIIACDGPDRADRTATRSASYERRYAKLEFARNDLDAFLEYYKPIQRGDPNRVDGRDLKSPGFFDCTERLFNPREADLDSAVSRIRQWVEINASDPEFVSLQINLMFAGHGDVDTDQGAVVIADGPLSAARLAKRVLTILDGLDQIKSTCRFDLYLDCCHSAAIARDLYEEVYALQEAGYSGPAIGFGKVYCACLDDEASAERYDLRHGLFTFAFLNEMSRRVPDGPRDLSIGLRDLGWFTTRGQHPIQLDFTHPKQFPGDVEPRPRYPCLALLDQNQSAEVGQRAQQAALRDIIAMRQGRGGELLLNPIDLVARAGRYIRDACAPIEKAIARNQSRRHVFSRAETTKRSFFWT
jgi:hypothetical protein